MFCQNCGKELPEGAGFCPECGSKITENVTVGLKTEAKTVSEKESMAISKEETIREKYFNFQSRLNRKRYILRSIILSIVSGLLAGILAVLLGGSELSFVVCAAISIAGFVAELSLIVRRLHDLNHSGLFWLLSFIPLVNFFLAIYLIFFKGTDGENRYGPDPLAW